MNSHKNARLTLEERRLLIERIVVMGLMPAASPAGISLCTARKWRRRFEAADVDVLMDASSRPARTRGTIDAALGQRIEKPRRNSNAHAPHRRGGRAQSDHHQPMAARLGLSSMKALQPPAPVVRYEHGTPGAVIHMDTEKLGRIERSSHLGTGSRHDSVQGAG